MIVADFCTHTCRRGGKRRRAPPAPADEVRRQGQVCAEVCAGRGRYAQRYAQGGCGYAGLRGSGFRAKILFYALLQGDPGGWMRGLAGILLSIFWLARPEAALGFLRSGRTPAAAPVALERPTCGRSACCRLASSGIRISRARQTVPLRASATDQQETMAAPTMLPGVCFLPSARNCHATRHIKHGFRGHVPDLDCLLEMLPHARCRCARAKKGETQLRGVASRSFTIWEFNAPRPHFQQIFSRNEARPVHRDGLRCRSAWPKCHEGESAKAPQKREHDALVGWALALSVVRDHTTTACESAGCQSCGLAGAGAHPDSISGF